MKKALAIAAFAVAGLAVFGRQKAVDVSRAIKGLRVGVKGIRNISIKGNGINFDLDLSITNTTTIPLGIQTGGAVTLSRLIFKDRQDNAIGESFPNISQIQIAPGETLRLSDIPTVVAVKNIGPALNVAINAFSNPESMNITAELNTPAGKYLI